MACFWPLEPAISSPVIQYSKEHDVEDICESKLQAKGYTVYSIAFRGRLYQGRIAFILVPMQDRFRILGGLGTRAREK
jgi:hypothetical protein